MLWEQQLPAFSYAALPAIPSQLQSWEIIGKAGRAGWPRLSGFFMAIQRTQPCMEGSDGLDPAGIGSLLPFFRLSQTICENLVSLLLGKLGLPDSCAPSRSSWFCRIFFEFLAEPHFLLYFHLFCKTVLPQSPLEELILSAWLSYFQNLRGFD